MQLVILELQQEDSWTELKCICQNQDQKQEVVTQIKLEGEHPLVRGLLYAASFLKCLFEVYEHSYITSVAKSKLFYST